MIAAAHRLLVEQGYGTTSVSQIATEARVRAQTVYRNFDNKATLLRHVVLAAVSGTDPGSVVREMESFMARVSAAETAEERLRVVAAWSGATYERGAADLEEVVFSAASSDPRVEELAGFLREQRYQDVRALVTVVAGDTDPPQGITLDDIADYIYAVWSGPVFRQLVRDRGWSIEKYIEWCVLMVEKLFLNVNSGS